MSEPCCYLFVALPCEAKPLISHFKLKKELSIQAFSIYRHQQITLTVTGIGKSAMAAGLAYTLALLPPPSAAILLNIGIAGHRSSALGTVFAAEKIIDQESARAYYPQLVSTPPCATETITTVSAAQLDYAAATLYEMEASAFYETAIRFSSSELIQCIKVISDNSNHPATNIKPAQVSQLITEAIATIEQYWQQLSALAVLSKPLKIDYYAEIVETCYFTHSEKIRLTQLLSKRSVLIDDTEPDISKISDRSAKAVLKGLQQELDAHAFGGFN